MAFISIFGGTFCKAGTVADGVAGRLLPGDRIVSLTVYEGDGTEPLPAREENGPGEDAAALSRAARDGSAGPSP